MHPDHVASLEQSRTSDPCLLGPVPGTLPRDQAADTLLYNERREDIDTTPSGSTIIQNWRPGRGSIAPINDPGRFPQADATTVSHNPKGMVYARPFSYVGGMCPVALCRIQFLVLSVNR